jgi:16S rRNA (guanine1207-N2)-methyltransferase
VLGVGTTAGRHEPVDHYFASSPATASAPAHVDLVLPDVRLRLRTDRGVFAREGVDPGTKLLLLESPMPPPQGPTTVVDVGCGYGPIALTVAQRAPAARVWAVDVNERARALCRANAGAAGLDNVVVVAPEEVPADLTVDWLFSNPPIRVGKAALHALLAGWLERLSPTGRATLVVHKHLGSDSLIRWLGEAGWDARKDRSRLGYRLIDVRRPAT